MHGYMIWLSGGPGAVVPAWKVRLQTLLWHSSFKETKCFFRDLKPHSFHYSATKLIRITGNQKSQRF